MMAIIGHNSKVIDFGPRTLSQDEYERLRAVKERPYWGIKQVRSPDEIEVGRLYILHRILTTDIVIRIISIDNVVCTAEQHNGTQVSPHLTDLSVLPYDGSSYWNKNIWLEQLDAETFDEASVKVKKPTLPLT